MKQCPQDVENMDVTPKSFLIVIGVIGFSFILICIGVFWYFPK